MVLILDIKQETYKLHKKNDSLLKVTQHNLPILH